MPTRREITIGLPVAAFAALAEARAQSTGPTYVEQRTDIYPPGQAPLDRADETYSQEEVVQAAEDFFDSAAGGVAAVIARVFRDQGRPVGYITGREGAGAWLVGLRYGKGDMFLKSGERSLVNWQGPSFGFDFGGNASKVFTLVYGMTSPEQIYKRYPGVEGSAYVIGGLGVNYQAAEGVTLAPIRAGVGLRGGANIGYLSYTRTRHILPF